MSRVPRRMRLVADAGVMKASPWSEIAYHLRLCVAELPANGGPSCLALGSEPPGSRSTEGQVTMRSRTVYRFWQAISNDGLVPELFILQYDRPRCADDSLNLRHSPNDRRHRCPIVVRAAILTAIRAMNSDEETV